MKDKPRVSVILPIYNASPYLKQCVESILQQTLTDIELICIDDFSTDNSVEILSSFQEKDDRIRIVCQEKNLGAGAARNAGIALAEGEYLSFLDADDYFDPQMLEISVTQSDQLKLDVFVFGAKAFDESSGQETHTLPTIRQDLLPDSPIFCAKDIPQDFFQIFIWWAWDKLFRKEYIDRNGLKFQEIRTSNDLLFTASAVLLAEKIAYTQQPLAFQRQKVSTSLSSTRHLSYNCCLQATMALEAFLHQQIIYEQYERDFKNYALTFLIWNLNSMHQSAFDKLFIAIKAFFTQLVIEKEEISYQPFYNTYQFIITHSSEDYLFYLKTQVERDIEQAHERITQLEEQYTYVSGQNEKLQNDINEFIDRVEHLTSQAHHSTLTISELEKARELLIGEHQNSRDLHVQELTKANEKIEEQRQVLNTMLNDLNAKDQLIETMTHSLSWKITSPLRWLISRKRN